MDLNQLIDEITQPRFGREYDPCWEKYHRWTKASFPIQLPACRITCSQSRRETSTVAVVTWKIERDVPIIVRLTQSNARILTEILPEANTKEDAGVCFVERSDTFSEQQLTHQIGLGFEWVFNIPVKPAGQYQPAKALGIVMIDRAELLEHETTITIEKCTKD